MQGHGRTAVDGQVKVALAHFPRRDAHPGVEIICRGRGSLRTLRRLSAQLRQDTAVPAPPPAPPARKAARWILTPPGDLASELRGFAKGLRKDWAAVTAGLTRAAPV
jgi:hypothetical protein